MQLKIKLSLLHLLYHFVSCTPVIQNYPYALLIRLRFGNNKDFNHLVSFFFFFKFSRTSGTFLVADVTIMLERRCHVVLRVNYADWLQRLEGEQNVSFPQTLPLMGPY